MKAFTGIKDVDLTILSNLNDKDLLNVCSTNKYVYDICKREDSFWKNRFIKRFGKHASEYKPEERTWKNHYMQTIIDLDKYKNDPMKFLNNIYWRGSVENSFYLTKKDTGFLTRLDGGLKPFLEAPEWIMTNFWLLDLGEEIKIVDVEDDDIILNHPTPNTLLTRMNFESVNEPFAINGFSKRLRRSSGEYLYIPKIRRY